MIGAKSHHVNAAKPKNNKSSNCLNQDNGLCLAVRLPGSSQTKQALNARIQTIRHQSRSKRLIKAIANAYYGILFTALAVLETATLAEVTGKFNVASYYTHPQTD
ncbi:hypothetical protein E4U40_001827 [Claviceps sp. LM458 group G5]|nr:hypothetical protein E4U40_001827 [Claviceps sp. LM458 group G5]